MSFLDEPFEIGVTQVDLSTSGIFHLTNMLSDKLIIALQMFFHPFLRQYGGMPSGLGPDFKRIYPVYFQLH